MAAIDSLTDEQFDHEVLALIQREFGIGGLARFLRLYRSGHGNYTNDRERWLQTATLDEIIAELEPQV